VLTTLDENISSQSPRALTGGASRTKNVLLPTHPSTSAQTSSSSATSIAESNRKQANDKNAKLEIAIPENDVYTHKLKSYSFDHSEQLATVRSASEPIAIMSDEGDGSPKRRNSDGGNCNDMDSAISIVKDERTGGIAVSAWSDHANSNSGNFSSTSVSQNLSAKASNSNIANNKAAIESDMNDESFLSSNDDISEANSQSENEDNEKDEIDKQHNKADSHEESSLFGENVTLNSATQIVSDIQIKTIPNDKFNSNDYSAESSFSSDNNSVGEEESEKYPEQSSSNKVIHYDEDDDAILEYGNYNALQSNNKEIYDKEDANSSMSSDDNNDDEDNEDEDDDINNSEEEHEEDSPIGAKTSKISGNRMQSLSNNSTNNKSSYPTFDSLGNMVFSSTSPVDNNDQSQHITQASNQKQDIGMFSSYTFNP
jgi:hypothetical protein